jgi:hypothetical protein
MPTPRHPFCTLCGTAVQDDSPQSFRLMDVSAVQNILRRRCVSTAFHYAAVMKMPSDQRHPLCSHCVNWARRANHVIRGKATQLRGAKKALTPLDSILMYTLVPGYFPEPDERCFMRLAATAVEECNGFATVIPFEIKSVLRECVDAPSRVARTTHFGAWWKNNERTAVFRHAETARVIRHTCVLVDPTEAVGKKRWRR